MGIAVIPQAAPRALAAVDVASAALAAEAKAQVEARYQMALFKPRDVMQFRKRLLDDCERPTFARVAEYALPRGGKTITGLSVRFVDAALNHYGNVLVESTIVSDDPEQTVKRVQVTDLETNRTVSDSFTIRKTVERRQLRDGQVPISSRTGSDGNVVYLVAATDDDLLMKANALTAKARRTLGLSILPGDIVEEARETCADVRRRKDAEDPKAAARKIADSFAEFGIEPVQLAQLIGHPIDSATVDEVLILRSAYIALKDGLSTWAELKAEFQPQVSAEGEAVENEVQARKRGVSALQARLDAKKAAKDAAKKAAKPAAAETTPAAPEPPVEGQDDRWMEGA